MAQWKTNPRVLIVHGGGGCESEDSYISVVAVPNLGCLDCKKLRDEFYADAMDGTYNKMPFSKMQFVYVQFQFHFISAANRCGYLCIKCNFTIHTKYCRADSDPVFNPTVNLQCLDKILIVANGLIHMIHIDLHMNKSVKPFTNTLDIKYIRAHTKTKSENADQCGDDGVGGDGTGDALSHVDSSKSPNTSTFTTKCLNDQLTSKTTTKDKVSLMVSSVPSTTSVNMEPKNIVEKIIADFAECESDVVMEQKTFVKQPQAQHKPQRLQQQQQTQMQMQQQKSKHTQTPQLQQQPPQQSQPPRKASTQNNFNELIITCRNNIDKPLNSPSSTKVRLLNHRSNRIISRSVSHLKNSITKVDFGTNQGQTANASTIPGGSSSSNKNLDKAAKAYEFSEDNEKCEKISTFRKRRLADKKYEFCEDNTENIIPYNRMRSVIRTPTLHQKISRHSPAAQSNVMSYSSSPPSTFDISTSFHTHRASPSYPGFRSPCGSPVGNRFLMMSPPGKFDCNQQIQFPQFISLQSVFFVLNSIIHSTKLLQCKITIMYAIGNNVTTKFTKHEAALLRYHIRFTFEFNFITTKWWLW